MDISWNVKFLMYIVYKKPAINVSIIKKNVA